MTDPRPATSDARLRPPIAAHWVKNNILAAIIFQGASIAIFGVRYATGAADADAGFVATVILYLAVVVLWTFAGAANGVLTGAVLQRIVPALPVWTWIALHSAMALIVGVGAEMALAVPPGDRSGSGDYSILGLLVAGSIMGAIIGAVIGALEALVLRMVALGTGAWFGCSIAAFAITVGLLTGSASVWEPGNDIASELISAVLLFLGAIFESLVMLFALRRLRNPVLSTAGRHFS
jgi:hypothetical protein